MLLAKIEGMEQRLAASRPLTPSAEPSTPGASTPAAAASAQTHSDTTAGRTGANSSVSLDGAAARPPPHAQTMPAQEVTLEALIKAIQARSQAEPRNLTLTRQLLVLYLLAGRDEEALQVADGVSPTEQAVWRQIMWALVNYTDDAHGLSEGERAAEAIRALDEARRLLMKQAPLEIRNLAFCTEIRGFGNFTPVASNEFQPNQLVLLYCELDGFTVEQIEGDRGFRTPVKQALELLTPRGDSVWTREFREVEDRCLSPRRDFYFYSKFTLPDRLLPGQYVLKVTMTDSLAAKTVEETLPMHIR